MKKFLAVLLIITFTPIVFADIQNNNKNFPEGTFKKNRKGEIIQYNSKGKKIGVYKINNGKYLKIK